MPEKQPFQPSTPTLTQSIKHLSRNNNSTELAARLYRQPQIKIQRGTSRQFGHGQLGRSVKEEQFYGGVYVQQVAWLGVFGMLTSHFRIFIYTSYI